MCSFTSTMDAGHLKRPSTGTRLLSASRRDSVYEHVPQVPAYSLVAWSLGRASVVGFSSQHTRPHSTISSNDPLDLEDLARRLAPYRFCNWFVASDPHLNRDVDV